MRMQGVHARACHARTCSSILSVDVWAPTAAACSAVAPYASRESMAAPAATLKTLIEALMERRDLTRAEAEAGCNAVISGVDP